MSISFKVPNPMRNQRTGTIISFVFILIGAIRIEPYIHFTQSSPGEIIIRLIEHSLFDLFLILVGLLQLLRYFLLSNPIHFGKKKCATCQKETQDILVVDGDKRVPYCRNHLLQEFSKSFLQFPHRMIVFHPEQDRNYCGTMYPYYPLSEFDTFNFSKEDRQAMEKIIREIKGECMKCKKDATVAYYRKGLLQWDGTGPKMRNISSLGELLCKDCTLERIEPDLKINKNPFADNGLFIPYSSEGVFINTYL